MKIITKSITINGQRYNYWLGVTKKQARTKSFFSIYFYPTDPDTMPSKPQLIASDLLGFDEAVEFGKTYVTDLMKKVAAREEGGVE